MHLSCRRIFAAGLASAVIMSIWFTASGGGAASGAGPAVAPDGRHQTHWVVAKTKDREVAIDPVSGRRVARPRITNEYPSPDGTKRLVLQAVEGAPHDRELFLIPATDKKQELKPVQLTPAPAPEQITDDKGAIVNVEWFPDSKKFLYQRGWLSFIVDLSAEGAAGGKPKETRLGERDWSVYSAAVSSTGQVAFLKLIESKNKSTIEDLMVWDGSSYRVVVPRTDFLSLTWSPDGTKIAASTHGELMLIDAATGAIEQTREYPKIDERLYAHHASSLAWSPDGTEIAAVLHFSGGRLIMEGEKSEPMFGDREIFVIPVDATHKVTWFTLDEDTREADWVKLSPREPERAGLVIDD